MSASIEPQGKSGKRSLTADLNLVPYIDLLTCMVAFLLITAVWAQLAQLNVKQYGSATDGQADPPMTRISVVVAADALNVVVNQDREVLPNKDGEPDWKGLSAALTKAKGMPAQSKNAVA